MKKLFFVAFCFAVMSFISCGGHATGTQTSNDSDSIAVDTLDSVSIDTVTFDSTACQD